MTYLWLFVLFVSEVVLLYKIVTFISKHSSEKHAWEGGIRHVVLLVLAWHVCITLFSVGLTVDLLERNQFLFNVFLRAMLAPATILVGGLILIHFSIRFRIKI